MKIFVLLFLISISAFSQILPLNSYVSTLESLNNQTGLAIPQCPQMIEVNCLQEATQKFVGWCEGISTKKNIQNTTLDEIKAELTFLIDQDQNSDCQKLAMKNKMDQLAFFINQKSKLQSNPSCLEYAKTKDNLITEVTSDRVWGKTIESTNSDEVSKFREELIYPKTYTGFEFIASAHTAMFSDQELMATTNEKLLNHLKTSDPKVVEVERSDTELNCRSVVPNLFKTQTEVIQRGEHEVAIWYAVNNQKILRGGEPEENDFKEILPLFASNKERNYIYEEKDYYYFKVHRCLAQIDIAKKSEYPTWEKAYEHCKRDIPAEYEPEDDSNYRQWFSAKVNLKPSAFRKTNCSDKYKDNEVLKKECSEASTSATDAKDLYNNDYFELLSTPYEDAEPGSMAYLSNSLGHIKNFCLRKNLQESMKDGKTSVVYGGGHLFENYYLLDKIK